MKSSFTLYCVPVPMQRPRFKLAGGKVISYKTTSQKRAEAELARELAKVEIPAPFHGAVRVSFKAFLPIPQTYSKADHCRCLSGEKKHSSKPDLDNLTKQLWDAITRAGFWKDDCFVASGREDKAYSDDPRWEVEIEEI